MYVAVAPNRTPPVEIWGLLIKLLQALLLAALLYLAITPVAPGSGAETRDRVA